MFNLVSPSPCPSCPFTLTWLVPVSQWHQLREMGCEQPQVTASSVPICPRELAGNGLCSAGLSPCSNDSPGAWREGYGSETFLSWTGGLLGRRGVFLGLRTSVLYCRPALSCCLCLSSAMAMAGTLLAQEDLLARNSCLVLTSYLLYL